MPAPASIDTAVLRAELERLRSRYDSGAVSLAVFATIRELETAIAWAEHRCEARP
jgi:hypothetical protein